MWAPPAYTDLGGCFSRTLVSLLLPSSMIQCHVETLYMVNLDTRLKTAVAHIRLIMSTNATRGRSEWQKLLSGRVHQLGRSEWQKLLSGRVHQLGRSEWQKLLSGRVHQLGRS